jgi:phosphoenolpyruvate carboxykinase (GTP)
VDVTREQIQAALRVEPAEWRAEMPLIEQWFDKIGAQLPTPLSDELEALKLRLAD